MLNSEEISLQPESPEVQPYTGPELRERKITLDHGREITLSSTYFHDLTLYHGAIVPEIKQLHEAKETTIGNGLYLTSQKDKAAGYAYVRSRGAQPQVVYEVNVRDLDILNLTTRSGIENFAGLLGQELRNWKNADFPGMQFTNVQQKATVWNQVVEVLDKIGRNNFRSLHDLTFHFGNITRSMLQARGYDGLMAIVGGEFHGDFSIGDHDSYVIFDPSKTAVLKEEPVDSALLPLPTGT